ncbi:iron uptake transporter permease EfeU [Corynebacterium pacaense]|uniref:iron uptake transporter permease EfeU n=1 Tax=Corynebacterium pacaense TaxID=1816684 RepID=UPI0011775EF2|nr:iron uptake transporter permease EfeU [Corynebacterium pacaense]
MMLATFLIGLREGLEASLIIGILLAHVRKVGQPGAVSKIWWGVGLAVSISVVLGAILTFGRYGLSFKGQEIIGGSLSLLAVAMVTGMVMWMMTSGQNMKKDLEASANASMVRGAAWGIFWLAFISVAREGLETTIMIWGWASTWPAFIGALLGILTAVGLGILLYRGVLRFNLGAFFTWTGGFLIIMAAGILAYGIHDLQEAAVLPGPFSGAPITPTNFRTGEVLVGFDASPFWMAAYPFGWAWDVSESVAPDGILAAFAKGTIGWTPQMSWLEVSAWLLYLAIVVPLFIRKVRAQRAVRKASTPKEIVT